MRSVGLLAMVRFIRQYPFAPVKPGRTLTEAQIPRVVPPTVTRLLAGATPVNSVYPFPSVELLLTPLVPSLIILLQCPKTLLGRMLCRRLRPTW